MIAAAQIEARERKQFEERIGQVEKSMCTILPLLGNEMGSAKHQVSSFFFFFFFFINSTVSLKVF